MDACLLNAVRIVYAEQMLITQMGGKRFQGLGVGMAPDNRSRFVPYGNENDPHCETYLVLL
jgi:hypothetical protein